MIKTLIRAISAALISIVLISTILVVWTGYAFIAQPTKSSEILFIIQDIYENQKSLIIDVVDLSSLLLKDASEIKANKNDILLSEDEFQKEPKGNSQLDESSIFEDNGDNPLRIVIEKSLEEVRENRSSERSEEPSFDDKRELSLNKMEINY